MGFCNLTDGVADLARLAALLRAAERILIFTGAGISTPSGIPDYRGPQGVWKTRQPVYYADFMSSHAARVRHWSLRAESAELFGNARPNAVHRAVCHLEQAGKLGWVLTQNVDGLHAAAGTGAARLIEIHGSTRTVECQRCGWTDPVEPHLAAFRADGEPPLCACGGYLKTATISFGQPLRASDTARAQEAAQNCDLVIAMGSTLSVQPASLFPLLAAERGVPYAIINRGDTDHDGMACVSLRLEGDVVDCFPPAVQAALG